MFCILEIDLATIVGVERAKDVWAELLSVALRKQLLVDFDEFGLGEFARRTVDDEARVPDFYLLLGELGVLHEELQVGFRQLVLGPNTTHYIYFFNLSLSLSLSNKHE